MNDTKLFLRDHKLFARQTWSLKLGQLTNDLKGTEKYADPDGAQRLIRIYTERISAARDPCVKSKRYAEYFLMLDCLTNTQALNSERTKSATEILEKLKEIDGLLPDQENLLRSIIHRQPRTDIGESFFPVVRPNLMIKLSIGRSYRHSFQDPTHDRVIGEPLYSRADQSCSTSGHDRSNKRLSRSCRSCRL